MLQDLTDQSMEIHASKDSWSSLYRMAGVGALTAVLFMLVDILLSFAGSGVESGQLSALEWFAHFNRNGFIGMRDFGLFNVINTFLILPLYLAVFWLHRKSVPATALLALILYILGSAIYDSNNRALAMLSLSNQYAAAASEAQKSLLATAGTVILAQAEDFTPGTFLGLFTSSVSMILMSVVLLRGYVIRRWVGLVGLVGTTCLLIFTVSATFVPTSFRPAMVLALVGGLLMLAWNITMALQMFELAKGAALADDSKATLTHLPVSGKGQVSR